MEDYRSRDGSSQPAGNYRSGSSSRANSNCGGTQQWAKLVDRYLERADHTTSAAAICSKPCDFRRELLLRCSAVGTQPDLKSTLSPSCLWTSESHTFCASHQVSIDRSQCSSFKAFLCHSSRCADSHQILVRHTTTLPRTARHASSDVVFRSILIPSCKRREVQSCPQHRQIFPHSTNDPHQGSHSQQPRPIDPK